MIDDHLKEVLASPYFAKAVKSSRLLVFLLHHSIPEQNGPVDRQTIATEILGQQKERFDPTIDSVVRVAMHRLRRALKLFYSNEGRHSELRVELVPREYRVSIVPNPTSNGARLKELAIDLSNLDAGIMTAASHRKANLAIRKALRINPGEADLWALYSDNCLDDFKYSFGVLQNPLDEAYSAYERAAALDPTNPTVLYQSGMLSLFEGDVRKVRFVGKALKSSPVGDEEMQFRGRWLLEIAAPPENQRSEDFSTFPVGDNTPGWLHHSRYLSRFNDSDYEGALLTAIDFGMPNFVWGPLERAAAAGMLGLKKIAAREFSEVERIGPNLVRDPERHLRHHILHDDSVFHVLEGLERAGLQRP